MGPLDVHPHIMGSWSDETGYTKEWKLRDGRTIVGKSQGADQTDPPRPLLAAMRASELNPEVYLVAAEMVEGMEQPWKDELETERGPVVQWCCDAIREACKQIYWDYQEGRNAAKKHQALFETIFQPANAELIEQGSLGSSVWWLAKDRGARLTALTMAAAIVESPTTKETA